MSRWMKAIHGLPQEGQEVIAVTRHHPKGHPVNYTRTRCIFQGGQFIPQGSKNVRAVPRVRTWRPVEVNP